MVNIKSGNKARGILNDMILLKICVCLCKKIVVCDSKKTVEVISRMKPFLYQQEHKPAATQPNLHIKNLALLSNMIWNIVYPLKDFSVSVCLFLCFFLYSSETGASIELNFLGWCPLGCKYCRLKNSASRVPEKAMH